MPENDDQLSAALREYYVAMAQQPAPDVIGRVMVSADRRNARMRRWTAIGGGALAAAAVGGVVAVALVTHNPSAPVAPAHSSTPGPAATAAPPSPSATAPSSPSAAPPGVGQPVHGFVPTDVSAISATDWWVLGYNGPCSSATCTRIVHTPDGGQTFTSIPTPPVAPAQNGQQALRLRFADQKDGWVVTAGGDIWATYDGGQQWIDDAENRQVTDLEASGNSVYAIACLGTSCWIQKSPLGHDSWTVLPASEGASQLSHLTVNGTHVWATIDSPGGGVGSLIASSDGGQGFSTHAVCPSALGYPYLYADDTTTLWATCATGTEAAAYRSTDGGQSFSRLTAALSLPNFASIAGVSQTTAVIAGQTLIRTTDGGHAFATVDGNQSQWAIVGFTTSQNGFAFNIGGSGRSELQRTDDAGAHWHQVTFP